MPPHLTFTPHTNLGNEPNRAAFLDACGTHNAAVALQLAPYCGAELLSFGFEKAIDNNDLNLASQLLQMGVIWGAQSIRAAAKSYEAVKWLVESGYDVNTTLAAGTVLLSFIVARNNEAGIRYLLEHGADPNLGPSNRPSAPGNEMRPISHCGHTLNEAAASCTPEIFALLLSHGAVLSNARPVHYAAAYGKDDRIPMLEYLIGELELDINELDDAPRIPEECRGRDGTPLHLALMNQKYETAKWLLEHGADPNKPMRHTYPDSTPRMWVRDTQDDKRFSELLSEYPVK